MSKLIIKNVATFDERCQKPFYHKAVQTVTSQLFVKGVMRIGVFI